MIYFAIDFISLHTINGNDSLKCNMAIQQKLLIGYCTNIMITYRKYNVSVIQNICTS